MRQAAPSPGNHSLISRKHRLTALLLAGVAISVIAFPAMAQDALRGPISDGSGAYQPASPGALTQDDVGAVTVGDDTLQGLPITPDTLQSSPDENPNPRAAAPQDADQSAPADTLRTGTVNSEEANDTSRAAPDNEREPAIGNRPRPSVQQDPFAPVGIRAGSFILRPSIEQGIRATSNADNSSSGKSATLSETTLRLNAQSDWSRHQATLDASGAIAKTISGQEVSEPRIDIESGLRLDLDAGTTLNAGAGYHLRRESASNPSGITDALKRPIVQTLNGSLGVERDMGVFFGGVTARVARDIYGDAELSSGGKVSQEDRNNNFASVTLRGGYEISEAIKPFAEIEAGKLIYDEKRDNDGYARDATRLGLRAGAMIDMGEKLNGEFAAGVLRENIEDERLKDISGLSLNAAMNWSPQRGTDVKLAAQTIVEGATAPGESGNILYLASIDVTRLIRANLTLEAGLDLTVRDNRDGTGLDHGLGAQVGATYWFNRFIGVNGSLRHEYLKSDVASREYTANSVYVGVKVQR